jgi:hypothetical protein
MQCSHNNPPKGGFLFVALLKCKIEKAKKAVKAPGAENKLGYSLVLK